MGERKQPILPPPARNSKKLVDIDSVLKAINAEPEFPGRPTKLMSYIDEAIKTADREWILHLCRQSVRLTKEKIAERIRSMVDKSGEKF